jgi:hypothetical protein
MRGTTRRSSVTVLQAFRARHASPAGGEAIRSYAAGRRRRDHGTGEVAHSTLLADDSAMGTSSAGDVSRGDEEGRQAMRIAVTTEGGELLQTVAVAVTDDPFYPVGRGPAKAAILAEIEAAARAL